jgi:hypothetical protein
MSKVGSCQVESLEYKAREAQSLFAGPSYLERMALSMNVEDVALTRRRRHNPENGGI